MIQNINSWRYWFQYAFVMQYSNIYIYNNMYAYLLERMHTNTKPTFPCYNARRSPMQLRRLNLPKLPWITIIAYNYWSAYSNISRRNISAKFKLEIFLKQRRTERFKFCTHKCIRNVQCSCMINKQKDVLHDKAEWHPNSNFLIGYTRRGIFSKSY